MTKTEQVFTKIAYASFVVLSLFIFTSFSLSAAHHILVLIPGIYFTWRLVSDSPKKLSFRGWSLFFLFVFILLSIILNLDQYDRPAKAILKSKYFLIGFLAIPAFYIVNSKFLDTIKRRFLVNSFLFSTTLGSSFGLLATITGYNYLKFKPACHKFRTCGMYGMTITYGNGIALALILMVTLWYFRKPLEKYFNSKLLYISIFINSLGLFFSYARGAMAAFICGLLFLLWFKHKKLFVVGSLAVVLFFGLMAILSKNGTVKSRYLVPWKQPTNILRIHQAQAAYYGFTEKPVFGMGFRNFEPKSLILKEKYNIPKMPGYVNWLGHAHNNYLEILVGSGIFAFLLLLFWHGSWLLDGMRSNEISSMFFLPFVVTMIISGLFQSTIIDGENMFLIMGIYAVYEALKIKPSPQS